VSGLLRTFYSVGPMHIAFWLFCGRSDTGEDRVRSPGGVGRSKSAAVSRRHPSHVFEC